MGRRVITYVAHRVRHRGAGGLHTNARAARGCGRAHCAWGVARRREGRSRHARHHRARVGGPVRVVGGGLEGGVTLPGVGDLALVAGGEAGARENVFHKCHALHLGDVPLVQPLPSEGCRPVKRPLKFFQLGEERKKAACVLEQ